MFDFFLKVEARNLVDTGCFIYVTTRENTPEISSSAPKRLIASVVNYSQMVHVELSECKTIT